MSPGHLLWILFGPSTWGAGGNMVAWVICGTLGFGWLHGKEKARHLQKMAQAAQHHKELLAQAQEHHVAQLAHLAQHCADVKAHVNAVVSAAAESQAAQERLVPPGRGRPQGGDRM